MKNLNISASGLDYHMSIDHILDHHGRKMHRIPVDFITDAPMKWQMLYSFNDTLFMNHNQASHTQDFYELIVHLKSSRKFMIENTIFEPNYGDCILLSPGERHMGIEPEPLRYVRYYILINPGLLPLLPDGKLIEKLFEKREGPNVITFDAQTRDMLLSKLAHYQQYQDLDDAGMMGLRTTIMDLLRELYICRENSGAADSATPPLLSEILHYIHTEYAVIESAAAIAERFEISNSYLSRLFRQWLHTSPYHYLMCVRLDEARRMLESGTSVTDACFASGFSDCSHFIAYFRREMGITPSEIRKKRR